MIHHYYGIPLLLVHWQQHLSALDSLSVLARLVEREVAMA
jgi:hypothetical protein